MTTLADYLQEQSISTEDFAKRVKVDPISVGRYLRGERRPNWEVMRRIVKETDGSVTPNDFMEVKGKKRVRPSQRDDVSRAA